jgi:hypothetical protein
LPLFPFLSVLVCAIGMLVVVFAGTALTSLESTSQTYVVSIREVQQRDPGQAWEREPVYIVCDAAGVTVYRSADDMEVIPSEALEGSAGYARLQELVDSMVRLRRQRWPVLFVKPSGLRHMELLYGLLGEADVRVGKWAFSEESNIVWESVSQAGMR